MQTMKNGDNTRMVEENTNDSSVISGELNNRNTGNNHAYPYR